MLQRGNRYVQTYLSARDVIQTARSQNHPILDIRLTINVEGVPNLSTYNAPTGLGQQQVGGFVPTTEDGASSGRDIICHLQSGGIHRITDLKVAYHPLHYPLLFPTGQSGWFLGTRRNQPNQ